LKPVVLQLIDSFHQGGSERQALQLTRLLHESGRFQVRLASLNPEGILRADVERLGLGEIPSYPLNNFYDLNAVKQLRRLVSFLRRACVDILHTHDFYTNVFGMTAGTVARLPVRIASLRETTGMRTSVQRRALRMSFSLANQVVANSNAVRQRLIEEGVAGEKITVIYNGLDEKRLISAASRASVLSRFGLPLENGSQHRKFVTIVANMRHEVKDYPMFLRAARRIKDAIPAAAFLLAGEGDLTESIRSLSLDLKLEDSSFLLGRCENLAELLSISDVCVLSSKAEGFSNSILEYMAAGCPVVATDVGGAREAIIEGETGYLVRAGDDALMAEHVVALLSEPERARTMGQTGKRLVSEKFSCDSQLSRTEELYERLLQQSRR
jgi:L-malate glycosyltransferase